MSQRSARLQTLTDDAVHLMTVRCAAFNHRLTPAQIEVIRALFEDVVRAAANVANQTQNEAPDPQRERRTTQPGFRSVKPPPPPVGRQPIIEVNPFRGSRDDDDDRPTLPAPKRVV